MRQPRLFLFALTSPFLTLCDQTFTTTVLSGTTEMKSISSSLFSGHLGFFVACYAIVLLLLVHTFFPLLFLLLKFLILPLGYTSLPSFTDISPSPHSHNTDLSSYLLYIFFSRLAQMTMSFFKFLSLASVSEILYYTQRHLNILPALQPDMRATMPDWTSALSTLWLNLVTQWMTFSFSTSGLQPWLTTVFQKDALPFQA